MDFTIGGLPLALIIWLLFLDGAVVVHKGECLLILRVRVTRCTRVTRTKVALQLSDRGRQTVNLWHSSYLGIILRQCIGDGSLLLPSAQNVRPIHHASLELLRLTAKGASSGEATPTTSYP